MRTASALAACLISIVALVGCGEGSSDPQGDRTIPGTTSSEKSPGPTSEHPAGREEAAEKKHPGGERSEGPVKKVEKSAGKQKQDVESKAAQEATDRVERLRQQASREFTRKELERIAERARAQAERLVDPPAGKSAADVLREIEEEAVADLP